MKVTIITRSAMKVIILTITISDGTDNNRIMTITISSESDNNDYSITVIKLKVTIMTITISDESDNNGYQG